MSDKAEPKVIRPDTMRWLFVVALGFLGVVANHYLADKPLIYRVLLFLASATVCLFLAFKTEKGQRVYGLLVEAKLEIKKVIWPTRQETTQTTLVVVAVVLVMALLLWGLDTLLGWLVSIVAG